MTQYTLQFNRLLLTLMNVKVIFQKRDSHAVRGGMKSGTERRGAVFPAHLCPAFSFAIFKMAGLGRTCHKPFRAVGRFEKQE